MPHLPFAKLEITDGTNRVDLLNQQESGFMITDWAPVIQELKDGGTWADPPTADERELIVSQLANVEDQLTFDVAAANQDQLIGYLRALRTLLTKARQYTTTQWQDEVVYIIAQSYGETNARYTRVKNWRTPQDGFPYGPPMWDTVEGVAIEDFQIIIEHGFWLENVPGTSTAIETSVVETYDGRSLGNVDSTGTRDPTIANEVFAGNKQNIADLTDAYRDNGGAWSGNLMDTPIPFNLLPAVPAVNDAVYFGIDTTLANSGPFASLIFDISIAGTGYLGVWEYWNGAWVALSVLASLQDNTDQSGAMTGAPFDTTGVNGVFWRQQSDWLTRNLALDGGPAITGYWIRMRVTGIPGALTSPVQQHRDIYSVNTGYVEIQSSEVLGDIPALARLKIHGQSTSWPRVAAANDLWAYRFITGLRNYNRGANFTAYINLADEQNPTGITVSIQTTGTFVTDVRSPTGRALNFAVNTATFDPYGMIALSSVISAEYYGQYRLFLRGIQTGGTAGSITLQVTARTSITQLTPIWFTSQTGVFSDLLVPQIIDLGSVTIGPVSGLPRSDIWEILTFRLRATGGGVGESIRMFDMILMPIDERASDTSFLVEGTLAVDETVSRDEFLDLNSIGVSKIPLLSIRRNESTDEVNAMALSISNGIAMLQSNTRQKLWFLVDGVDFLEPQSTPEAVHSVQIERNQRYWSMRGDG